MTLQDNAPSSQQIGAHVDDLMPAQDVLTHGASVQQLPAEENASPTHEDQPFDVRLKHALDDKNLQRALGKFAPGWRISRSNVFATEEADYGTDYSFVNLRSMLRDAKDDAIARQPELIAQFKANARAAGAIIYEAQTAEDANRYIYELCRRKGIDLDRQVKDDGQRRDGTQCLSGGSQYQARRD